MFKEKNRGDEELPVYEVEELSMDEMLMLFDLEQRDVPTTTRRLPREPMSTWRTASHHG